MRPTSMPGSGSSMGLWGALGPKLAASRTPVQGSSRSGAAKRSFATGGRA